MLITASNPFKGRQHPGELIISCVRLYFRYPLSYEHVTELMEERGVEVDASCIWRWVQVYSPELRKRCRSHLKPVNKRYRIDETYIKVKGQDKYLYRTIDSKGAPSTFCSPRSAIQPQPNAFCAKQSKHRAARCRG